MAGASMLVRISVMGDPPSVWTGDKLRLVVELAERAPQSIGVIVTHQRLLMAFGGYPELRPTYDYFDVPPRPIRVNPGHKFGLSEEIKIKRMPGSGVGEPPLMFPEHLLFTAWMEEHQHLFQSVVLAVEEGAPGQRD